LAGYHNAVNNSETVFEALKELVSVSNPGLVTKEDLSRLESRLDELGLLFDEIEARVLAKRSQDGPQEISVDSEDEFDDSL